MTVMADTTIKQPIYIGSDRRSLVATILTGFVVGVGGWLLDLAIQRFFVVPVFCNDANSFSVCANGGTIAWVIAIVIVSVIGLFSLVRINVFRPLLVVLAAVAALWGVFGWLGPLAWWQATLWQGVLFALAYILFTWIARTERFPVAFIVTVLVIILLRLVVVTS
jgi:hypothetical protein